jgi:hypothetical protein
MRVRVSKLQSEPTIVKVYPYKVAIRSKTQSQKDNISHTGRDRYEKAQPNSYLKHVILINKFHVIIIDS